MNSSDPKTPESATNVTPDDKSSKEASSSSLDNQITQESVESNEPTTKTEDGVEGEDDEEAGECGFCLYMKGGGCRDAFIDWENCVKEADDNGQDVVNKCFEATSTLRKCMQAHADYYEPILRAEKAAEEEATKELVKEKASTKSESNGAQEEEKVMDSEDS